MAHRVRLGRSELQVSPIACGNWQAGPLWGDQPDDALIATIRQAHERPEGMDEGTLIMAGLEKGSVLNAIGIVTAQGHDVPPGFRMVSDYAADNVSKKVVRIIVSYIDYVNRTVWSKDR